MKGTFYGIGVGPGDPELLSIKAVKMIKQCPVVAYPKPVHGLKSTAYQIAKPYLQKEAQELPVSFAMERDLEKRKAGREAAADKIAEKLEQGKDVAFLTLGDPAFYSTCMYLSAILESRGFHCEMIPGIPAVCAMAAKLHKPLAEGDEAFLVLPVSKEASKLAHMLPVVENIALMKVSKKQEEIWQILKGRENGISVFGISDCGMAGEKQYHTLDAFLEEKELSYFTSLMLKKQKASSDIVES